MIVVDLLNVSAMWNVFVDSVFIFIEEVIAPELSIQVCKL